MYLAPAQSDLSCCDRELAQLLLWRWTNGLRDTTPSSNAERGQHRCLLLSSTSQDLEALSTTTNSCCRHFTTRSLPTDPFPAHSDPLSCVRPPNLLSVVMRSDRSPSHSGLRTSFDCRSTIRVGLPTGKGSTLPWGGGVLVAGPHSQECWRTRVVPAVLTGRSMLPPLLSVRFVVVTFFCRLPGSRS